MEYLRLIGSYGRLTSNLRLIDRSWQLVLDLVLDLYLDLVLEHASDWSWSILRLVLRPASKNLQSEISRFRGTLLGIRLSEIARSKDWIAPPSQCQ